MGEIIPENKTGVQTNTEELITFDDPGKAVVFYKLARSRLMNINRWQEIAGTGSSEFRLFDENGEATSEPVREGFYFRIDVPGPGTATGDGFDWVRVEAVEEMGDENSASQLTVIRVRPSDNPKNNKTDTAHFFTDEATSSFVVERVENIVKAGIYGRNEKPNLDVEKIGDKLRNAIFGAGAAAGASKMQWVKLVRGILRTD